MSAPEAEVVRHNAALSRFEIEVEGGPCIADYVIESGRMVLTHTFVPPVLRGRGLAEKLVRSALADARARGLKVVPACSYVALFIKRHAEYRDLLAP